MPASPSDGRGKWKRRKREPQISRRQQPKHDDPEEEDEDDAVEDDFEDANLNHIPPDLESEVIVDSGVRICDFPTVTKIEVNQPHALLMAIVALERANLAGDSADCRGQVPDLENVSYGQLEAISAVPAGGFGADQERDDGGRFAYVFAPPPIMEGKGVVKQFGSRIHVVPMHSDWFSPEVVNRLERQVVPHFFSGKSPDRTPQKYMECRNHIVAKYMENPEKRITVSDCQGLVVGIDDEDLTRIIRFLEHWGIINYCAAMQSTETWNDGSYVREDPNGEVHVPSAALKSIDSLIKFEKPKCRFKAAEIYSSLSSCDDDFSDLDNRIRERFSENCCAYCSQSLPGVCYQSQKEIDVLLCSNCFHEGKFVADHSSLDFVKMDSIMDAGDLDGETWSDQETFLLLEAVEMYNENWNEIAEHVGSKSKSQCILHFLGLPLVYGLLENIEVPNLSNLSNPSNGDDRERVHLHSNGDTTAGVHLQAVDYENRVPFGKFGNPVMGLVAFLASAVGPRVAAACAHASLAILSEDRRMSSERSNGREEENSNGSWSQNETNSAPLSAEKVEAAAKAGLSAAATKAKLFADHEEREIQRLSANIINHQMKRLELKLKQIAEIESMLIRECEQVEKTRQRFAAERARLLSTSRATSQVNMTPISPSMANNSNSQQIASPNSSSQPGFVNNQQLHPQLFSMGQRPPLSTSPSNAVFSGSRNSQPSLNPMLRSVSGSSSGLV